MEIIIAIIIIAIVGAFMSGNDSDKPQNKSQYASYTAGRVGRTLGKSFFGRGKRRWRL